MSGSNMQAPYEQLQRVGPSQVVLDRDCRCATAGMREGLLMAVVSSTDLNLRDQEEDIPCCLG